MQSLLIRGIDSSAPLADSITYLTSVKYLHSISADCGPAVEKIKDLLSTPKTRLYGLILLKIALEQNSDVYVKGNWPVVLYEILNDSVASTLKEYACEVFCMLLPYMTKESAGHMSELRTFSKDVFPFLITQINENVEWTKAALKCVHTCLKNFPQSLVPYKDSLIETMLKEATYSVSSEIFEIVADCFAEFPNLLKNLCPSTYLEEWKTQYIRALNTLHYLLNLFLTHDPFLFPISSVETSRYVFNDNDDEGNCDDVFRAYMKTARRYINLSKCLAKMLSTQSRFAVEIPIKMTLILTSRLFQAQELKSMKPSAVELQIFASVLSQMQLATLVILESLLLNFNVLPYSSIIVDLMQSALAVSKLNNISVETISLIRHAVWKFLKAFVKKYGSNVSGDVLKQQQSIFPEMFADITPEDKKSSESASNQISPKSKKNASNSVKRKCMYDENKYEVCKDALETLEQLVYTGSPYFSKEELKEVFSKILQISCTLCMSSGNFPFPYDDELCRKNLYSALLALALISNMELSELTQSAVGILKNAFQDPSIEVTGFCNIAMSVLNAKIHPKRPPPKYAVSSDRQRSSKVSSAMIKCPEWTSDEFVPNLPLEPEPKVCENVTPRTARTFQDPDEDGMIQEEPMEVGAMEEIVGAEPRYSESYASECYISKYPEHAAENHHNGDDILEIHHSNECQDEDSDEEDEEEEDEERSYGEEEINQEDIPPENLYIPSTSKLQVVNPVHISPETVPQNVADREYEQLRPCMKAEASNADSNKNMHHNGVQSIVPDADVPASSTRPSLANENGVYAYDEEDVDEEEGDEDEEEESASFPAEKRVPGFYPPNPPSKRQKLDIDEPKIEPEEDESPRSPTLEEMKADFCCTEIDDVKS